jgi:signal transduction histidine kinase
MRNEGDAPTHTRGLGLRTKLTLGFILLLAILVTVGVESISLLQQNVLEVSGRARELAEEAVRQMALLFLAGTAVAGLCVLFLSRVILEPLERRTRAAWESDHARLLRAWRIYRSTVDDLTAAVAVVSPDHRVELVNRFASTLLGLRTGEPLPERHGAWLLPLLDRAESGRLPKGGIEPLVRLSVAGRERILLPRATVLRDGQGSLAGWVVALDDLTDRRRCREVHAGLLANTAHDLEAALGAPGAGFPDRERLREIAANLLGMSRLEERREQLHLQPVPPAELVAAAVQGAEECFREREVKLAADVDPEAPRVLVDLERTGLLLPALLRNALAHTPSGGSVMVQAEAWESRVRFSVVDTGNGVPAAYRERIFEPLYQVPGTEDLGSVGLGLAIARDVVQTHGGEIHCASEEGRGATFWYTLPAAIEERSERIGFREEKPCVERIDRRDRPDAVRRAGLVDGAGARAGDGRRGEEERF